MLDFTFNDLYKPRRERLTKIFSYIINFIRFRESQTPAIDAHFNRAEATKQRIATLLHATSSQSHALDDARAAAPALDAALSDRNARAAALKTRLLDLKRGQERVADRLACVRAEQIQLKSALDARTAQAATARADAAKLRPYTLQSPAALEANLAALTQTLAADRAAADALDRRARAVAASGDAFATVGTDVAACSALLGELSRDLSGEAASAAVAARTRDALAEQGAGVREVERRERLLGKQLANVQARTSRLRDGAEARRAGEAARMEELRAVNEGIRRERAERGREMEVRRVRIEGTERRMDEVRACLAGEVERAEREWGALRARVGGYVEEMEGVLVG